jgi:hypothetical protein
MEEKLFAPEDNAPHFLQLAFVTSPHQADYGEKYMENL